MPKLFVSYIAGPLQAGYPEKRIDDLVPANVISFGHRKNARFHLPEEEGLGSRHAVITNKPMEGRDRFFLHPHEGPIEVRSPSEKAFRTLASKTEAFLLSHGMRFRIGEHTFEIVDEDVKKPRLWMIYRQGPLQASYPDKRLRLDFDKIMSFGHKPNIAFNLPEQPTVGRVHAVITKDVRGNEEVFKLTPKQKEVIAIMPNGNAQVVEKNGLILSHGMQLLIGPHRFQVVDQDQIEATFSERERNLMRDVLRGLNRDVGTPATIMHRYAEAYFADPYKVNRLQNDIISGVNENKKRNDLMRAAVTLNAKVEQAHHQAYEHPPTGRGYSVLHGADYLFHGDVLPGRGFVLGRPETYDREILEIHKLGRVTGQPHDLLVRARQLAAQLPEWGIATSLQADISGLPYRRVPVHRDLRAGPVTFVEEIGGVCRHKAALLAMCLQEAGIRCRYVRGNYGHEGHAWVVANIANNQYLFDPASGNIFYETDPRPYQPFRPFNVVWRPRKS